MIVVAILAGWWALLALACWAMCRSAAIGDAELERARREALVRIQRADFPANRDGHWSA